MCSCTPVCWLISPSFFFNDTATTEIYTLSLHDALPISQPSHARNILSLNPQKSGHLELDRSEEHTSELQSRSDLVCRLLLGKNKPIISKEKINNSVYSKKYDIAKIPYQ